MRPALSFFLACIVLLPARGEAHAQVVTSAAPESVAVTIYRAPYRDPDEALDLDWLEGYALVSEQRIVTLPAGRSVIRFEGVAAGMLPQSAIVTGLPAGVREKNLDADLLSPRSLYARSLGQPVTIRRMLDGKMTEERAIIRSGADGAAVIETRQGFTAVNCGPGSEAILYDAVPAGLSAKPTLSVEIDSPVARQVTLSLSYLSRGFDWQANYVATLRPDGKSADLFAWVTLANGDPTSFVDATTAVVAGKVNREEEAGDLDAADSGALSFHCYPQQVAEAPLPAPAPMAMEPNSVGDIIVTGSRLQRVSSNAPVAVIEEGLGDLKLYRVPHPTTVASMSQKQVALLDRNSVPVEILYRARIDTEYVDTVRLVLRAENRKDKGLGVPLPGGPIAVFAPMGERRLLLGEGSLVDRAVGERVDVEVADATQVEADVRTIAKDKGWGRYEVTVTNANPFAIRFEGELGWSDHKRSETSGRIERRNGRDIWAVEVPANGTAKLRYRLTEMAGDAN